MDKLMDLAMIFLVAISNWTDVELLVGILAHLFPWKR
jgi:hypothetical protein